MSSYLNRLAQVFAQEVGEGLSEYTFVFPNRRAGLFFRRYLGKALSRPIFSPEVITINECFASLSDLRVADQLTLLLRLYSIYREQRHNAEPIERFLHWGKMMLADFSEIDNHLVANVEALYAQVEDMRTIDSHFMTLSETQREAIKRFWGEFHHSLEHKEGRMHDEFLRTWKILYPVYAAFKDNLLCDGLAYEGLLHRQVISQWNNISEERFRQHYVFVGFNALTASEKQLLLLLQQRGCADFYFDYEDAYLTDPTNRASLFKDDNLRQFASKYSIPVRSTHEPPRITHVAVNSTVGEAREVYDILLHLYPEESSEHYDFTRTAVVLPDEQLLIPLLDCFPKAITDINVTMGYPLRASDLYVLVAYPEKYIDPMPTTGTDMLAALREALTVRRNGQNGEAYYLLTKVLDLIETAIAKFADMEFSAEGVMQIVRMLTLETTIPYAGEPLNGLQVMGVLETRALDFDNLIITGFNDDLYPGRTHSNSFIPYILRRGFGLPTPERQDAIFAYNFYRMLSYAQHVWLITNSVADEQHSGEVSRYLYQLQWQYGVEIERETVVYSLSSPTAKEVEIEKTEDTMAALAEWGKKHISASALNKYLYCQKQFYYRYVQGIHEPPKEEDITASNQTLGIVVHNVMQTLYLPYEKRMVVGSDIQGILDSLTEERWESLPTKEIEGDILSLYMVKGYVRNILQYDLLRDPFFYVQSERRVEAMLQLNGLGTFQFYGYIDRLDKSATKVQVIDYKTGKASPEFRDMDQVFDRSKNQDKALQTLLYCWMLKQDMPELLKDGAALVPHIYPVRQMANAEEVKTQVRPIKGNDFAFSEEVENDFLEHLQALLQEIFNPDIPFVPTDTNKRCESCAFVALCKR